MKAITRETVAKQALSKAGQLVSRLQNSGIATDNDCNEGKDIAWLFRCIVDPRFVPRMLDSKSREEREDSLIDKVVRIVQLPPEVVEVETVTVTEDEQSGDVKTVSSQVQRKIRERLYITTDRRAEHSLSVQSQKLASLIEHVEPGRIVGDELHGLLKSIRKVSAIMSIPYLFVEETMQLDTPHAPVPTSPHIDPGTKPSAAMNGRDPAGASKCIEGQDRPGDDGYVENPLDETAYLSMTKILNGHTPPEIATTFKDLAKILEDFSTNRVRWTRPKGPSSKPRQNRRNVHFVDWQKYLDRKSQTTNGWPSLSRTEQTERQEDLRLRRSGGT